MGNVVIIDDDLAMDILVENLNFRSHQAYRINNVDDAMKTIGKIVKADLVILDIIMPWPEKGSDKDNLNNLHAGMVLLQSIRKKRQDIPVLVYSATQDNSVIEAIEDDDSITFLSKWESHSVRELVGLINKKMGLSEDSQTPQVFIVHGQNATIKLDLKNYLQNVLHFPEPIILHEQPNLGRTIIEKFEDYAYSSSIVFVLLTPDDIGASVTDSDDTKRRARQNVIFEMGYFLGMLGRKSGRVILLYQSQLELPSDIAGIVYIDISNGIEAAGEKIRLEVQNVKD